MNMDNLPNNIDSEEIVLGACLLNNKHIETTLTYISKDDFYNDRNSVIYDEIIQTYTKKGYVDIRWFGESNGYYSESVDFIKVGEDTEW